MSFDARPFDPSRLCGNEKAAEFGQTQRPHLNQRETGTGTGLLVMLRGLDGLSRFPMEICVGRS